LEDFMRSTIFGLVLAAAFLAGLFALSQYAPRAITEMTPAKIAAQVEPGFTGVRRLGPWVLACNPAPKKTAPLPFSLSGKSAQSAQTMAVSANSLGRCRAFLSFSRKDNPKQIVLLMNVRLVGPTQRLVFIVRVPPVLKKGDVIALQWGKQGLGLPVLGCDKGGCVAIAAIAPKDEPRLMSLRGASLVFPPAANGKRFAVRVPFFGLRPAIGAMRRAETGG
jgi:hypothetical protein